MGDIGDIVRRALVRRHGITRSEVRELALDREWYREEFERVSAQVAAMETLVRSTLADAEPLKLEVENLRAAVAAVSDATDETQTLLVDARIEVRNSKAAIDAHNEWRQRAMRVVTAAKEWDRSPRSEVALRKLRDSVRTYGADA